MADDRKNGQGHDLYRIDLNQPQEVTYWAKTLGVNEELLRRVVAQVGNRVEAVRERLGK